MATVVIQNFEVGKKPGNLEIARVSGRVHFTQGEKDLNIRFRVRAYLYEQDDAVDYFFLGLGSTGKIPRGNSDDYVGHIGTTYLSPDGANSKEFSFERTWNFPAGIEGPGNEEYRAIVRALPDIRGDVAISTQISANLV